MRSYLLPDGAGEAIWMFHSLDTIKADADQTGGAFTVVEFADSKGSSVPLHVNDRWDRGFYVLVGEYTFVVDDEQIVAAPRTWIFAPRNTPLAWRCESADGRLLNVTAPGGFEDFYREVGESVTDRDDLPAVIEPDLDGLSEAASRYGITIVGPPPGT